MRVHFLLIDERGEPISRYDDELVKILLDSFVEICQEVPRAKTAREQFLPPVGWCECERRFYWSLVVEEGRLSFSGVLFCDSK